MYKKNKILSIAIINLENDMNVGGIIRTANAAGVNEVFIVGRKKWKKGASTGAHRKTKIINMRTTDEFLDYAKENNYSIVSLEITEKSENIFHFNYPDKTIIVIGNEGKGIPEKIILNSLSIIKIPQYGEIECLNAAISAGIAIFDWVRKNQTKKENKIIDNKFKNFI